MASKQYSQYLISPEIIAFQNAQALQFKGKDMRGYGFSVFISAIGPDFCERKIPESVDADRVVTYFGGDPSKIDDIGTKIEITIGESSEAFIIDSAAVVYIPNGQPFHDSILRKPESTSWMYSITLPPKYVQPD